MAFEDFCTNLVDLYRFDVTRPNALDGNGSPTASAYPATPDSPAIPCSLQIDGPTTTEDQMIGQSIATGWARFYTNYMIKRFDKLIWIDAASVTHTLFCGGQTTLAGSDVAWRVPVTERRIT